MEPYDLSGPYIDYYTAQPANGYEILNTYWFKFEPITWDLLSVNELQGPLLVSHSVLDSHDFITMIIKLVLGIHLFQKKTLQLKKRQATLTTIRRAISEAG